MIEVFEGRLGGGKTYTAVYRMASHIANGGTVVTNVRVKCDGFRAYIADCWGVKYEDDQLWLLPNDKIGEFHRHVPYGSLRGSGEDLRVLVVVDEAHLYFNARDWNQTSRELLAFLTQSDKVSVDVIFISQSALNIDKQFARLVQYIWRFRDLEKWKIPGLGIKYPLKQILVVQYDYDGKTILERKFVSKDSRVFGAYETAALLTDFPDSAGKAVVRNLEKVEKEKTPMLKYMIPIGIVVGAFAAWRLVASFGSHDIEIKQAPPAPASVPASAPKSFFNRSDQQREEAAVLFELYNEAFRGWTEVDKTLYTDSGWYQLGEMSPRGLVVAISERRVRIKGASGQTVWVVASPARGDVSTAREVKRD